MLVNLVFYYWGVCCWCHGLFIYGFFCLYIFLHCDYRAFLGLGVLDVEVLEFWLFFGFGVRRVFGVGSRGKWVGGLGAVASLAIFPIVCSLILRVSSF